MQVSRNYSDQELLVLIQYIRGVDDAVRYLYSEYHAFLSIYVQQHGGSMEDAEDIFQEVVVAFIDLVQKNKFRGESSIKTFLFALNRNIWLNELKKRKRSTLREVKFEEMKPVEEAGIAEYISAREGRKELMDIISKLGEVCRQILVAFYYQDLSIKEILEQLHYENEQVVRNKKHKCMKKLDELLQANPLLAKNLKTILNYGQ